MLSLLLASLPALPCAALMVEEGGSASTSAQEVILEQGADFVDVTYRVQVDNDVHQLGWIVPIYGDFVELADADPERFDQLRSLTAPTVWIEGIDDGGDGDGGGGGCGGGDKALRGGDWENGAQDLGVTVVAEGFSGTYAYSVLDASSDEALFAWLEEHGYGVGPSGPAIAAYVAEGGVLFVAIDVALDNADDTTRELPALRIRYGGDSLRFPSLMARYGMPEQVSTRAYVLGDQRATVGGGWSSEEFGERYGPDTSEMSDDDAFRTVLAEIGGDRPVYAELWSGSHDGAWLTRFDTVADKEVHLSDVRFALDGGSGELRSELWRWDTGEWLGWLLMPGALAGLAAWRRRPTGC